MRSIPPYSHHPRTQRVSAAPTVSAHHSREHNPVSAPGRPPLPPTVPAVGARPLFLICAALGAVLYGLVAWLVWGWL